MIIASLGTAGVEVVDFHWDSAGLPASAAWMLSACSEEDGREDVEFMFDDSCLIEGANAAWWDFAYTGRLFDEEGAFSSRSGRSTESRQRGRTGPGCGCATNGMSSARAWTGVCWEALRGDLASS